MSVVKDFIEMDMILIKLVLLGFVSFFFLDIIFLSPLQVQSSAVITRSYMT